MLAGFGLVMMNSPGLNGLGRCSPPLVAGFLTAVSLMQARDGDDAGALLAELVA